jgi:hypothetical protein
MVLRAQYAELQQRGRRLEANALSRIDTLTDAMQPAGSIDSLKAAATGAMPAARYYHSAVWFLETAHSHIEHLGAASYR